MCPRLFHIYGPLWIQSYGVMIAIGFLVFLCLTYTHPVRKKLISGELYLNTLFVGLVAGIVGGRLLFVVWEWRNFVGQWMEIFYPWIGGFMILGSIGAVLLVVPVYLKKHNVPILPLFDMAVVYAPLMQSIARLGCFFAGCCYGASAPSWLPWAVRFSDSSGFAPLGIWLHPSQIYSSLTLLVIFLILRFVAYPARKHHGQVLFLYVMLASAERFTTDFFRGDRDALMYGISQIQLLSCVLFIISLGAFFWVSYRSNNVT
ncbi:MAG: prolipoprotein diacylglyceryl transferase [bacterium]